MYRSPTYAAQQSKSVFVEMSERSAESARLVQQAREAEPEGPPRPWSSVASWAVSLWNHILELLAGTIEESRGAVAGQAMSGGTKSA